MTIIEYKSKDLSIYFIILRYVFMPIYIYCTFYRNFGILRKITSQNEKEQNNLYLYILLHE